MPSNSHVFTIVCGAAGTALLLGACSSSTDSATTGATPSTPEATVTVTAEPSASPAATMETDTDGKTSDGDGNEGEDSSMALPQPPAGSKQIADKQSGGATYARYSISGMTAEEVGKQYKSEAQSAGYTIKSSGGGGGGWGEWGGSEYGLTAQKDDGYLAVQAGGSSKGPTYFEVCVGPDSSVEDLCDSHSDDTSDSDSGGS